MTVELKSIGIIRSPFTALKDMPIQPAGAIGVAGTVEVHEEFRAGLKDLDGFSHIILLYHFHRSEGYRLEVVPFLDDESRGVFATRAPKRPNPLGMSVVRLRGMDNGILEIENIDVIDGTPLLDIKPYVPEFNGVDDVKCGWLESAKGKVSDRKADHRFDQGS